MPREVHVSLFTPYLPVLYTFPLWLNMYVCRRDVSNHTPKIRQQLNKSYCVFSTSWMRRCSLNLHWCHFWKTLVFIAGCMNNCLCLTIIIWGYQINAITPILRTENLSTKNEDSYHRCKVGQVKIWMNTHIVWTKSTQVCSFSLVHMTNIWQQILSILSPDKH